MIKAQREIGIIKRRTEIHQSNLECKKYLTHISPRVVFLLSLSDPFLWRPSVVHSWHARRADLSARNIPGIQSNPSKAAQRLLTPQNKQHQGTVQTKGKEIKKTTKPLCHKLPSWIQSKAATYTYNFAPVKKPGKMISWSWSCSSLPCQYKQTCFAKPVLSLFSASMSPYFQACIFLPTSCLWIPYKPSCTETSQVFHSKVALLGGNLPTFTPASAAHPSLPYSHSPFSSWKSLCFSGQKNH